MTIPFSLNICGTLVEVTRPAVMGILNATPDSFHSASRTEDEEAAARRVAMMIAEGVDIIDVGACSTRPGSTPCDAREETARLRRALAALRRTAPEALVSVDTFRADVARMAVEEYGVQIVNDITAGRGDRAMQQTVASLRVPYIIMHMRGTPADMQRLTDYTAQGDVCAAVVRDLSLRIDELRQDGVADIIADPGFGFAKTTEQNYALLANLGKIAELLGVPVLAGLSRKSMLTEPLGITPDQALGATVAAETLALTAGASILRVHDVAAAVQARTVVNLTLKNRYSHA